MRRGRTTSLDPRTKLARVGWRLVLYPDAGEAFATFQSAAGRPRNFGTEHPVADAAQVAARRARKQVRLYCASNRLVYLWTATYAPTEDARHQPRLVRQDVRYLFRRLRANLGCAFPYLWTTEWHSTGHGLHVHFAVGERVDIATVRSAWRRGHAWVSPPSRDGRGQVEHRQPSGTSPSTWRKITGHSMAFTATRWHRGSSRGRGFWSPLPLRQRFSLPPARWVALRLDIGSRGKLKGGPVHLRSGRLGNDTKRRGAASGAVGSPCKCRDQDCVLISDSCACSARGNDWRGAAVERIPSCQDCEA